MSFPKGFLDELKGRIRVSEVVGRKVKLTRRGREFVGLSPFSNEKSPSFTVNDDKQFYHCFSSGEHGDVIKFLEKTENLSFIEAVERLAAEAGMEMPERDAQSAQRDKEAATLIDVMEMAAQFFRQKLTEGVGAEARAYLERRGLRGKTIDDFGIGYAPGDDRRDRTALLKYLKSKNVTLDQMAEAGLVIAGPDIAEPYDRFRNRVMFPISDARGRVIAFGGRALSADAKAKYLNSPETPLFHKGRVLYNLARARTPAHDDGTVIAVEGYMDVVGLAQGGIHNAVAPLGTALTEDQIQLLWRMAPEPILCFDGDKAGLRAAFRAMDRIKPLLKAGHSFRFAMLPDGADPDDMVREKGVSAFKSVIANARSFPEMAFSYLLFGERLEGPDDRARVEQKFEVWLMEIQNELVRRHYKRTLKDWLWNRFADVFGWRKFSKRNESSKPGLITPSSVGSRRYALLESRLEIELLAYLLCETSLLITYFDPLNCLELLDRQNANILTELIQLCGQKENMDRDEMIASLAGRGLDGRLEQIRESTAYRLGRSLNDTEEIESKFLATLALFVARGQYAEVNRDALVLTEEEHGLREYFDRVIWLRKELLRSPLAGDDSEFSKIAAEYRAKREMSLGDEPQRFAIGS
ncbi:DNA primase [Parvibaculum sp.]|jgi:DNA primase|uniref:DNA primase n=1 Tax=Parvibaculum sp. TaxID=2024848 RepID=UPI000C53E17E|nr:DNA primase [Parvibaculum sp.]MAM94246.1 DNA primase [Parvibaculum sp.]|tara:strand:+ start:28299 stop:30212 length:1914 start_codon:yes stop_codon:yes gene_type:complete